MQETSLNNQQTLLISKKNSKSRYYFTNYVKNTDSNLVYDLYTRVSYDSDTDVTYHIVTEQDENRLDKISEQYYDDSSYWWLIAMANNIIDPFIVVKGTTLKIPTVNSFFLKGVITNNG